MKHLYVITWIATCIFGAASIACADDRIDEIGIGLLKPPPSFFAPIIDFINAERIASNGYTYRAMDTRNGRNEPVQIRTFYKAGELTEVVINDCFSSEKDFYVAVCFQDGNSNECSKEKVCTE